MFFLVSFTNLEVQVYDEDYQAAYHKENGSHN